jgi:hypothetical protein
MNDHDSATIVITSLLLFPWLGRTAVSAMAVWRARTESQTKKAKIYAGGLRKGPCFTKAMAVAHQVHTYTELRQQIHDDLRIQHPEWVQPNGESPMCDAYEARLMELLNASTPRGSNESIAAPHALEQGA